MAFTGVSRSHPLAASWLLIFAAAPVTPEALATTTGTLLAGMVVVVVVGWAGLVVVVVVATVDPAVTLVAAGWISLSTSTVTATKTTRTTSARSVGKPPFRPPESPRSFASPRPFESPDGWTSYSEGVATARQPANLRVEKQAFRDYVAP